MILFLILIVVNGYAHEIDDLIKSQDQVVKKHLIDVKQFIKDVNKNANQAQSKAQLIINNSKANCNKDPKLDWFDDVNLEESQNTSFSKELYVFVSLSIPRTRLIDLLKDAFYYNAVVVLRGLKNNSYKETANFLQPIIKEAGYGFIIDPNLFREYNITRVPGFVLNNSAIKKYDKVDGNINLKYALEEFAKNGDLKQDAMQILGSKR